MIELWAMVQNFYGSEPVQIFMPLYRFFYNTVLYLTNEMTVSTLHNSYWWHQHLQTNWTFRTGQECISHLKIFYLILGL